MDAVPLFRIEQRLVSDHFAVARGGHNRRLLAFIDVGRTNMGLCFTSNDWHWSDPIVEHTGRFDIAPTEGDRGDGNVATETADLVAAFVVKRASVFGACDRVFIERQPPGGMRDIEQLLYAALGGHTRVAFLSPNTLHAYFRMGGRHGWSRYDDRKTRSEAIAGRYISANGSARAVADWNAMGHRRHDASDATLMAIMVNEMKRVEWMNLYAPRESPSVPLAIAAATPAMTTQRAATSRKRPRPTEAKAPVLAAFCAPTMARPAKRRKPQDAQRK